MTNTENLEAKIAASIPLRAYLSLIRRPALGLVYHAVSEEPPAYLKHIYPVKSPDEFEQDLIYLKENFNPISYEQLLDYFEGTAPLPPKAILVSFDDGYRECLTRAAPLLRKHGIPCIFFLATGFLDNQAMFYRNKYSLCVEAVINLSPDQSSAILGEVGAQFDQHFQNQEDLLIWMRGLRLSHEGILDKLCSLLSIDIPELLVTQRPYLTRQQVQRLIDHGFSIGAHSVRHPKFRDLEPDAIREEILASCKTVSSLTGNEKIPFAFPFSGFGVDRAWLAELKQNNAEVGLFFETQGLRPEALFVFNRIWADPPQNPPAAGSNLDSLLHEAFQEYVIWRRRYYSSLVPNKLGLK